MAVQSGTLALGGGGISTGNYAPAAGAVLDFTGGTHELNAGGAVSGAGVVRFSGGTSNVNGGSYAVGGTTSVTGGAVNFNTAASTGALSCDERHAERHGDAQCDREPAVDRRGDGWYGDDDGGGVGVVDHRGGVTGLDRTLRNTGTMTYSAVDSSVLNFGATNVTPGVLINEGTFNVTARWRLLGIFHDSGSSDQQCGDVECVGGRDHQHRERRGRVQQYR